VIAGGQRPANWATPCAPAYGHCDMRAYMRGNQLRFVVDRSTTLESIDQAIENAVQAGLDDLHPEWLASARDRREQVRRSATPPAQTTSTAGYVDQGALF
jgi:hypothetical protein